MAQVRDAGVHADAIDPCRCLTLATKAGKGLPQVQRHLLKEVADAFIVASVHQADLIDHLLVVVDEGDELLF